MATPQVNMLMESENMSSPEDQSRVEVTVEAEVKPTFIFQGEIGEDETAEEATQRVIENAKHEAAIALKEAAHEYEWVPRNVEIYE